MIKILCISFLFISSLTMAQTNDLKLASDIWPPFTDIKGNKALALDIVEEALARADVSSTFQIDNFNNVITGIRNGRFHGSAALWHTKEREAWLVFSDAYLENQLVLVGRKGSNAQQTNLDELIDVRLGVVKDYAYGESLSETGSISLIYGHNDQQNLEKLLSEKVDYILVDAILIQYLLKYQVNDVSELLEIGKSPLITKTLHLAIKRNVPDAEKIIEGFNAEVQEMIADGTYNEILGLNWIRVDVDGDGITELVLEGDKAGNEAPVKVYNIYTSEPMQGISRYYIEGEIYDGWNNIPERYKKEAMQGQGQDPTKVGFKL